MSSSVIVGPTVPIEHADVALRKFGTAQVFRQPGVPISVKRRGLIVHASFGVFANRPTSAKAEADIAAIVASKVRVAGYVAHILDDAGGGGTVQSTITKVLRFADSLNRAGGGIPLILETPASPTNRFSNPAALMELASKTNTVVCIDTCHLFVAGRTLAELAAAANSNPNVEIAVVHFNDAQHGFGSGRDVHANISTGHLFGGGDDGVKRYRETVDWIVSRAAHQTSRDMGPIAVITETPDAIGNATAIIQTMPTLMRRSRSPSPRTPLLSRRDGVGNDEGRDDSAIAIIAMLLKEASETARGFRSAALVRGADALATEVLQNPSGSYALLRDRDALMAIPGIGAGIADRIVARAKRGGGGELVDAAADTTTRRRSASPSPDRPSSYKHHHREARRRPTSPTAAVIERERRRMPRRLAQAIARDIAIRLLEAMPGVGVIFAGSLRRKTETIGDIDVLIKWSGRSRAETSAAARAAIAPITAKTLAAGDEKTMLVLNGGVRVDLMATPPDEWVTSLLYFTGSKEFNIAMRAKAKRMGLTLNEHGLYRDTASGGGLAFGVPNSEREVFAHLGMKYVPPERR